ncbi:MAG TPA: 2-amino-4-hydroxy-6-hydroxymethyldihydropteridine diphosphokinase [Lapillicoccus sp.]|nr:2-amino-4-hydroxy-6-hydroxymethyldihydropteridine diphosphokinase [Lapillicoccus sp.]
MTDRIHLRGVEAVGFHGVLPDEKRDGQTFVVDVVMELDLAQAGATDDLEDTVSYADIAGEVMTRITGPSFDLIERLADVIADDVLGHALVDAVTVTVHKPEAPVGHPFSDVAVEVHRRRGVPVVVALGANLGDARATLEDAVRAVGALTGMRVRAVSPLVETDPVGGPEQPAYLNAVLVGETTLAPEELLTRLHEIEADHGRTREVRWGARTLDLDLVQVGMPGVRSEVRSDRADLTLPHPRAHERGFVLVPWSQADPDARLRVGDDVRPVTELVAEVDSSGVRPGPSWSPTW